MSEQTSSFEAGESQWINRLDSLRNVIRQEVIARQLEQFVEPGMSVLDVGCGQGTKAIRLAQKGCQVTGVDPSSDLLGILTDTAKAKGVEIDAQTGQLDKLPEGVLASTYDLVCAHGLLIYLGDRESAMDQLTQRVESGGLLSVTIRNGDALAMRPGLRRDWATALAAMNSDSYINELGVEATADHRVGFEHGLERRGFKLLKWFGVRVFNDGVATDAPIPQDDELAQLIEAEYQAGETDPYRSVASQLHFVARKT